MVPDAPIDVEPQVIARVECDARVIGDLLCEEMEKQQQEESKR